MAAFALESAGRVRQKTRAITRNPCVFYILKAFFLHLAANKSNPDLQILPFSGTDAEVSTGTVLATGVATLYLVWGKKTNTATDAYLTVYDDASDDTTTTRTIASLAFLLAGASTNVAGESIVVFPDGIPVLRAVNVISYTTQPGSTASTAGDAPNGFVIVGA